MGQTVIFSVINDISTDQRVLRSAFVFEELGYKIHIIGRKLKSHYGEDRYRCTRLSLPFKKGIGMYVCYNLSLLIKLFSICFTRNKNESVILFSNDLDTLLPNFLVSKLFNLQIIYDSHELFTEVPELINRPIKRKIWLLLEQIIVPKLKYCITVNNSIANIFFSKYKVPFNVVRNISDAPDIEEKNIKTRQDLNLPVNKKIILLQGAGINIDRGAEELILSAKYLSDEYLILIIGSGDVFEQLKQLVITHNLSNKVLIKNKMSYSELFHYTKNCDLGISIDKATSPNYLYSLPNKIFSYIHAGLPILASHLPEIENIITQYQIGIFIDNHTPKHIAEKIQYFISSQEYQQCKCNTMVASRDLTWSKEKEQLVKIIKKAETKS